MRMLSEIYEGTYSKIIIEKELTEEFEKKIGKTGLSSEPYSNIFLDDIDEEWKWRKKEGTIIGN